MKSHNSTASQSIQALLALAILAPGHARAVEGQRVAIVVRSTVDDPGASGLSDALATHVSARSGFAVVPTADLKTALEKRGAGCSQQDDCVRQTLPEVKADLALTVVLEARGKRYVLSVAAISAGGGEPKPTSESMRHLSSLPANVDLCLDRLLKSTSAKDAPAAETSATRTSQARPAAPAARSGASRKIAVVIRANEADASGFPQAIARQLDEREGFATIETAAVEAALAGTGTECRENDACVVQALKDLRPDVVLSTALKKAPTGYVLEVSASTSGGRRQTTSETMRRLSSLDHNIGLCLDRLLAVAGTPVAGGHEERGAPSDAAPKNSRSSEARGGVDDATRGEPEPATPRSPAEVNSRQASGELSTVVDALRARNSRFQAAQQAEAVKAGAIIGSALSPATAAVQ